VRPQPLAVREPVAATAPAVHGPSVKPSSRADPVALSMTVAPAALRAGGTFEVAISLDVGPGYEVYPLNAPSPAVPTRLELNLPPGFHASGGWHEPPAVRSESPGGHRAHAGRVTFVRTVVVGDDVPAGVHRLGCAVRYQACTAHLCLSPMQFELESAVSVAAAD
jgi:hypothetical protein